MKFIKDRIEVILEQLKDQICLQSYNLPKWQMKEKCFVDVAEASGDGSAFQEFDSNTMRWYGKDKHYWFRNSIVVPDSFDGKNMWLHIRTQIDERENCRNPQFLVFINGVPTQGMDINHSEVLLTKSARAGETIEIDLQA
jgi:alpha-mannosidase